MKTQKGDMMDGYISKDTARRIIDSPRNREQMLAMLEDTPSADVQPVVRCKNCKHYRVQGGMYGFCNKLDLQADVDDFCSEGEKMDGGQGD